MSEAPLRRQVTGVSLISSGGGCGSCGGGWSWWRLKMVIVVVVVVVVGDCDCDGNVRRVIGLFLHSYDSL